MRYIKYILYSIFFLISLIVKSSIMTYDFLEKKLGQRPFYILGDVLYALGIGILGSVLFADLSFSALLGKNGIVSIALIVIGAIYREKNTK